LWVYVQSKRTPKEKHMNKGAVVITGASSGIGRACALALDRAGFLVFAGVRRAEDAASLQGDASSRLAPILLDVTDETSLASAVFTVREALGGNGLTGLVNNAGVGLLGPLECLPLDDIRRQFEINVFGQIAVTQAFLPLLRTAGGRIINMGSVGGRFALPFGGPLCASKSAFASLTDSLRLELCPWGIHACLIEPASIATPAVDKVGAQSESMLENLSPQGRERYGALVRGFVKRAVRREQKGSPPEAVAKVVVDALTAKKPKARYPVGADARLILTLAHWLPEPMLDRVRLRLFGLPTQFGVLAATPGRPEEA